VVGQSFFLVIPLSSPFDRCLKFCKELTLEVSSDTSYGTIGSKRGVEWSLNSIRFLIDHDEKQIIRYMG